MHFYLTLMPEIISSEHVLWFAHVVHGRNTFLTWIKIYVHSNMEVYKGMCGGLEMDKTIQIGTHEFF